MRATAGDFNRRIQFEIAEQIKDGSGDVILAWPPTAGRAIRRWAKKADRAPQFMNDVYADAQQDLRQMDVVFTVRGGRILKEIGPENARIVYKGKSYQITGKREMGGIDDEIDFWCCVRPDEQGASGREGESGYGSI